MHARHFSMILQKALPAVRAHASNIVQLKVQIMDIERRSPALCAVDA